MPYGLIVTLSLILIAVAAAYLGGFWHGRKKTEARFPGAYVMATADLQQQLAHALAQWADWERRAGEFRGTIAGILGEKQVWIDLYQDSVICHGNAQTAMMDAIGHLHGQLQRLGKDVRLPPMIAEAQQLFLERHVNPVIAQTGTPVLSRGIDSLSAGAQPTRLTATVHEETS